MAASMTAAALLSPLTCPPPAAAEGMGVMGMEQAADHPTTARTGTAAAEFSCSPLTPQERATYLDLRGFSHKVSSASPEAQALFDQGLLLTYNFNRPEAINSFKAGLQLDPDAAMMHWGIAHALGPYANKVWGPAPADSSFETITPDEFEAAQQEVQAGLSSARSALEACSSSSSSSSSSSITCPQHTLLQQELAYLEAEAELWGAVDAYDDPAIYPALETYAKRLEAIAAAYPSDPDALGLAAEARMNISPWVHWEGPLQQRRPFKADTVVLPALADLAEAFRRSPGHPMAAHLMIHLTEAATPGVNTPAELGYAALGEAAADSLARDHPFPSMGHLTHMPSHTFIRLGRWADAVSSNQAALEADEAAVKRCVMPYMPEHNSQQLIYAAMNIGQYALAEQQAQAAVDFPKHFGPTTMADGRERVSKPLLQVRFAQWEPLLALTLSDLDYSRDGIMVPPTADDFGRGVYHYARALAYASAAARATDAEARQQLEQQMQDEVEALSHVVESTPDDVVTRPGEGLGVPSPGFKALGRMELLTAQARGDVLRGQLSAAADKLRAAVDIDQTLGYTEPPRQYQPMQECLGWVLLQQGELKQAEQVYLEDLEELPENAWALKGLQQVYAAQGPSAADKLAQVEARLSTAWSHADPGLTLSSSCPSFSD